jgi:glucose-6-phosphate 1-dehydrogenase
MYYDGRGVARDMVQAHMWSNLAAVHFTDMDERTNAVALRNLAESEMTGEEIIEAQALATEWKPKEE